MARGYFMKLSCLPVSLYPEFVSGGLSIADWAEQACRFGLDAIDLSALMTRRLNTDEVQAITTKLENLNMPVDTIVTYTDFTHPDAAYRRREFDLFKSDLKTAARLGARYARITAGQARPEIDRRQGVKWVFDFFRRAADVAQKEQVALLFENHSKPGVWEFYDFAGAPEIYFELIERLDGIPIDLLFDTANVCFYRQDPLRTLERIFSRVRRVHVADIVEGETLKPIRIGGGIAPLREIFGFLRKNAFSGALSIEEASFTGFDGVEKAIGATRKLWADASAIF